MDQPERRSTTGFGSHNGTSTLRWGYVGEIGQLFHACEKCVEKRKNIVEKNHDQCDTCCDWEYDDVIYHVPGYPAEMLPEHIGMEEFIEARKIEFEEMEEAAVLATEKLRNKEWKTAETKKYLKEHGWNGGMQEKIIGNSNSKKILHHRCSQYCPLNLCLAKESIIILMR